MDVISNDTSTDHLNDESALDHINELALPRTNDPALGALMQAVNELTIGINRAVCAGEHALAFDQAQDLVHLLEGDRSGLRQWTVLCHWEADDELVSREVRVYAPTRQVANQQARIQLREAEGLPYEIVVLSEVEQ